MRNFLNPWFYDFCGKTFREGQKAKILNNNEFWIQYTKLLNLSLTLFEYEGLPDTFDRNFFEFALITGGMACIADDKTYGIIGLRAGYGGNVNIYGYPLKLYGYGVNGHCEEYTNYIRGGDNTKANAVAIFDNPLRLSNGDYLYTYAARMADCMRAIDVAMKKLKNPYYVVAPSEMVDSIKKAIQDIDQNKECIISSNSLRPEEFKVVPTNQDGSVLAQLWQCYNKLYDIAKEFLGIKNINSTEKMERLITTEADSPDMVTDISLQMRLEERQRGLDEVNELFGLNARVKLRDPFEAFDELINDMTETEEGDQNDGGKVSEMEGSDSGAEN